MRDSMTPQELDALKGELRVAFPEADEVFTTIALAWGVLVAILGKPWCEIERYRWQYRITRLAELLYELQPLPGFEPMRRELLGRSMEGAFAELETAWLFASRGHRPVFPPPRNGRGKNCDLLVVVHGTGAAVEVKAIDDSSAKSYQWRTIYNQLQTARKQLPASLPGLIVLLVPAAWTAAPLHRYSIEWSIRYWLRRTERVNAVYLLLTAEVPANSSGYGFVNGTVLIANPTPRVVIRNLPAAIAGIPIRGGIQIC